MCRAEVARRVSCGNQFDGYVPSVRGCESAPVASCLLLLVGLVIANLERLSLDLRDLNLRYVAGDQRDRQVGPQKLTDRRSLQVDRFGDYCGWRRGGWRPGGWRRSGWRRRFEWLDRDGPDRREKYDRMGLVWLSCPRTVYNAPACAASGWDVCGLQTVTRAARREQLGRDRWTTHRFAAGWRSCPTPWF
jgi:hypothetical protein